MTFSLATICLLVSALAFSTNGQEPLPPVNACNNACNDKSVCLNGVCQLRDLAARCEDALLVDTLISMNQAGDECNVRCEGKYTNVVIATPGGSCVYKPTVFGPMRNGVCRMGTCRII